MKKVLRLPLMYALAAMVVGALLFGVGSVSKPTSTANIDNGAPASDGAGAAGFVVHIDPESGVITDSPQNTAPLSLDQDLLNALDTSTEGLVEEASPVKGGGVVVDLRGRFKNSMVMTVDETGHRQASCVADVSELVGPEKDKETGDDSTGEGGDQR